MDLRRMAVLAVVVERGSMRQAARALNMTASAVSQQIRRLERKTGVTLLRRSTRRLALTEVGQEFYEGCAAMLAAARAAHERLAAVHDRIAGELSVSAPVGFATAHLPRALAPLVAAHPELTLRLVATDDLLDLARERIDVAVTIGTKASAGSLVRRHLSNWANLLVAAPAYLAARGTPAAPADLARHDFVALPAWHHPADVLTGPGGRRVRVGIRRRVTSNQLTIRELALAGCGLSFHVEAEIARELADGRLVRVLPDWSLPTLSVDALMLPRRSQPAKVRATIDALKDYLSNLSGPTRRTSGRARRARRLTKA
jgi:DNA-binding transcriptional LysR family regulator